MTWGQYCEPSQRMGYCAHQLRILQVPGFLGHQAIMVTHLKMEKEWKQMTGTPEQISYGQHFA